MIISRFLHTYSLHQASVTPRLPIIPRSAYTLQQSCSEPQGTDSLGAEAGDRGAVREKQPVREAVTGRRAVTERRGAASEKNS